MMVHNNLFITKMIVLHTEYSSSMPIFIKKNAVCTNQSPSALRSYPHPRKSHKRPNQDFSILILSHSFGNKISPLSKRATLEPMLPFFIIF